MLRLPDEPGLVPIDDYAQVFVRWWRPLDFGLFLIYFTNAKSGKSNAYRYAIVREGLKQEWKDGKMVDTTEPTWVSLATVIRATSQGDQVWRATVLQPNVDPNGWRWKHAINMPIIDENRAVELATLVAENLYDPRKQP